MEFYQYISCYNVYKKQNPKTKRTPEQFYKELITTLHVERLTKIRTNKNFEMANDQTVNELLWYRDKCPYYNIFPGIINPLTNLKLENVLGEHVKPDFPHILFKFPKHKCPINIEVKGKKYEARVSLCSLINENDKKILSVWTDFGDSDYIGEQYPIYIFRNIPLKNNKSIEETMNNLPIDNETINQGLPISTKELDKVLKVIISCFLLSKNSEDALVQPDILADDYEKFLNADEILKKKLFEKAQKRGKFGWNIGKNIEVSPHFRNPHPALYWTGEGKQIPKIIFRKGTFVHRQVIEKLPTGFSNEHK